METKAPPIEYVTIQDFAKRVSVSRRHISDLTARGVIPSCKLGRRCVRIPLERALQVMRDLETR